MKKINTVIVRKLILIIFFFISFTLFPIYLYKNFQIKTLIIKANQPKLYGLKILENNNLLFIDDKKITAFLQKQNPNVNSIHIIKQFPQTVILIVEDRIPIAQIVNKDKNLYVDKEGTILTSTTYSSNLVQINSPDVSIYSNQKVDWRIMKVISFIKESKNQGIIIDQILVDNSSNEFSAKTTSGIEVSLPLDADIVSKVSSLQVILQRFKIMGKNIVKINFRFDKPLIILANGEKISSYLPD